jgi:hypothetical protein
MKTSRSVIAATLALAVVGLACTATVVPGGGGGGSTSERLLLITGRTIPVGEALVFNFETVSDGRVNISVQADTDFAQPDFQVVIGEVTDLESTPIGDQVVRAPDTRDGQATASFTPGGPEEVYTIFILDQADWPGATFTITITQRT